MRKAKVLLLLLLFSLLFTACADTGTTFLYEKGEHNHVFGNRYDITPASCVAEGKEVRYCKICHEAVTETVPVAEDIAARKHAFSDTVTPPTESAKGYTRRECTVCDYVIERADVIPARYELTVGEGTKTTAPEGVDGILMSDSATHRLSYRVGGELTVSPVVARRLAVALAVTDELSREGATLTADTPLALISGTGAGNRYTVRDLLCEWIATGDENVLGALAFALDGSEGAFGARVTARLEKLGVAEHVTLNVFDTEGEGSATLGATAVMLARALDEPLIRLALAEAVPRLQQIAGQKPVAYLCFGNLRLSAVEDEGGACRFLLLRGESIPEGIENTLFQATP